MAAKTPTTTRRDNIGSLNRVTANFADIDNGDTWSSGIKNIVSVVVTDETGATESGIGASFVVATGVVTFTSVTASKAARVIVDCRS